MDLVFLDASVLFAAAYRARAGVRILWSLPNVELICSPYACGEAQTNLLERDPHGRPRLAESEQIERLDRFLSLLRGLRIVPDPPDGPLPEGVSLPDKDRPILLAAMHAGATHLLTADKTHFGPYFGQAIAGVLILPPSEYLRLRDASPR
jgi:hypothetical protein